MRETGDGRNWGSFSAGAYQTDEAVLDNAVRDAPGEAKRTSTMTAEIASQVLACAAKGERDPAKLRIAALLAMVECSHYSHDISPERRSV